MRRSTRRQIWIHALGAKVGGGLTYLRAILPELARQLDGRGVRVVLLVPGRLDGLELPEWLEVRPMPRVASSALTRLVFDQAVLPVWMRRQPGAVLYCSGSFSPLVPGVPTVALLRNAIYFDDGHLARELPLRRAERKAMGWLVARGARRCETVLYPSQSMRDLVEMKHPELRGLGRVNYYGVSPAFVEAGRAAANRAGGGEAATFLYVMTYTLQKNFSYLLRALALAKQEGLRVRVVVTTKLDGGAPASFAEDRRLVEEHDLVGSGYLDPVGSTYGRELVELYRSVDACVFPSTCESFGHPLVEAMAMGKPLVCADRPYARELCGDSAVYVDVERPEALVDVWRRWPEVGRALPTVPLEALADRFSWRAHVSSMIEVLLND